MTITIELPDDLTTRATAAGLEPDQVNRFAVVGALAGAVAAVTAAADQAETEEADPELIAALKESATDIADGRLLTLEEADASFPEQLAAARARIRQEKAAQRNREDKASVGG